MNTSSKAFRSVIVLAASLIATLFVAGCLGTLPQVWKTPPYDIVHTAVDTASKPITDTNADLAVYNGVTYIVFEGYNSSGGKDIFLKGVKNYAETASPAALKNLTNDLVDNCDPHIVSGNDGYLYITFRTLGCINNSVSFAQIAWMKVRASDLAVMAGPTTVSTLPQMAQLGGYNDQPRIAHSDVYHYSEIVWVGRPTTLFTPTIFYNRVSDAGAVSTPITVSVGTNCQDTSRDVHAQHAPRIGTSRPNGTYSMIAWYGDNSSGDSAYLREIYNPTPSFLTNCQVLSAGTPNGTDYDVALSVSPEDDVDTYVAWTKLDATSLDYNVYFARVLYTGTVCSYGVAPYLGSDSFNPVVAAGNSANKWMHLAYEHVLDHSHIWYNDYSTYDCNATPTSANTLGDSNGVITLTVSPWVSGHDGNLGVMASDPASSGPSPAAVALQAKQITVDQLQQLEDSGALSKAEIDSIIQNGVVNSDRLAQVLRARSDRPEQRRLAAAAAKSNAPTGRSVEGPALTAPSSTPHNYCGEDPLADGCPKPVQAATGPAPQSPSGGCYAPSDYVVVGWQDGSTSIDYATEIGASRYYDSVYGCQSGALATNDLNRLRTPGYANKEFYAPTAAAVVNGIAHIAWQGFAEHGCDPINIFTCYYSDDDIFYAVTHIPSYLPVVLKAH